MWLFAPVVSVVLVDFVEVVVVVVWQGLLRRFLRGLFPP